ncbi:MAG: hypothetical protein WDO56_29405 [Gammaproteobacteria bacterium]
MRATFPLATALALLVLTPFPVAHAQSATCATAQFNAELQSRFPNIRTACLDIVDKGGQQYAVIKADLMRTTPDSLQLRFAHSDGTKSGTQTVKVKSGFRVLVEGKPVRVEDLAVGQVLTAYVKVSEPVMALAPADDNDALDLTPVGAPVPVLASTAPSMPKTASPLTTYGVAGVALLLLAAGLAILRFRLRP